MSLVPRLVSAPHLQYPEELTDTKSSFSASTASPFPSRLSSAIHADGLEKYSGMLVYDLKPWCCSTRPPGAEGPLGAPVPAGDTSHPALRAGVKQLMVNTEQNSSESASQIHTHISSQCSGRNISPRFLVAGFPLIPAHWHALVQILTNTVISNTYPVINANNGSNIPFSDHLSSNKGCN